jgi:peroxiredoxin
MAAEVVGDDLLPEAIDDLFVPKMRPSVAWVTLDNETVLLDSETWISHLVDGIGTVILDLFDGQATLTQTAADLADAFNADLEVVHHDVMAFARQLGELRLLVGVSPAPPTPPNMGVEVGTAIEEFSAPTLDGAQVSLGDFRGQRVLLVNWHPNCSFCRLIAEPLAEAEQGLRDRGIELLLLSGGAETDNKELVTAAGMTSRVVLGEAGSKVFSGLGTPAAYLVDEEGRTAEPLALGAEMVPNLVRTLAASE